MKSVFIKFTVLLAVIAGGLISNQTAFAANWAWSTTPGNANFSANNWTSGTTPGTATGTPASGDSLYFGTSSILSLTNDDNGFSFGGIAVNSGGNAFVLYGNAFTLTGGLTNSSTSGLTISNAITVSGTVGFYYTTTGPETIAGNISGSGIIIQFGGASGGGTFLGGDNSGFTGSFTNTANGSANRLKFNSPTAGSAGAAWTFNNNTTDGIGLVFSNATINFGSLAGGGFMRIDSSAACTNTVSVGALNTSTIFSGELLNNSSPTRVMALTKVGTGTFTLSGTANTFAGATTVNGGTLAVTGAGTGIASGSAVAVNNTGTLIVGTGASASIVAGPVTVNSGGTLVVSNSATVSGLVTNNPGGTVKGGGTISGAVVFNASSGGLNATNDLSASTSLTLTMSGGLTLNSGNVLKFATSGTTTSSKIAVTGGGAFATPGGPVSISLNNSGIAGGTMTLITWASGTVTTNNFSIATAAPSGFSQTLQASGDGLSLQVVFTPTAPAAAFWKGAVDNSWGTADSGANFNWATTASGSTTTGAKPGAGSAVTFSVTGVNSPATTLDANYEIGSLAFTSTTSASISGSHTLTVDGGITVNNSAGPVTISATGFAIGGDQTWENDSSSTLAISSPIGGTHALTINNTSSGITTLSGTNSYSGTTTVNAGTLNVSGALTNTAVTVNSGGNFTEAAVNALGGIASLNVASSGTATLNKSNNNTGATAVTGTLQLSDANALAASTLTLNANSTLQLRANASTTFADAGLGSLASGGTFNLDVNNLTSGASQTLTLAGALNSSSSATETINVTGGNNYTLGLGAITQVNDTGLTLDVASGVNLTVASYAAGQLNGNNQTLTFQDAGNVTIGAITNTSPLANGGRNINPVFNQTGTVTLTATNDWLHGLNRTLVPFAINNGTLVIANSGALNASTLGTSQLFTLGSTTSTANNVNFLLGTPASSGGLTTGTSANKINSFLVMDTDSGTITIGGQNTSGVNTFSGNFTLGANPNAGKSVTLIAATGGEVDFTGTLLANGSDTTAGITVGDGINNGTVKLTGLNTYLGGSIVNSGTLALSSLTGTASNGVLTVNDGGTLDVIVSGTSQLTPSTLTVGSSTGATLAFANVGSTSVAPINPTTFTINGTVTVNIISLGALNVGTYPLVSNYVSGTTALGTLPSHVIAHLSTTGGVLSLVVTSFAPDIWAAGTGVWNTNLLNWKVSSVTTNYNDGEVASFDDTATGSGPFTVTVTNVGVTPSSVTVSNVTKNYTIAGGAIGGGGSLTKNGNGTLIIANTNTYTLGTIVSAGTLQLGDGSANNGGVAGTITDNSLLIFANPTNQTFSSVISGTGSVVKNAAGALTLGVNNSYSGGTALKAGSVVLPNGATNSFGSGTLTLSNVTLVIQANSGSSYNSANSDYIGNNVAVPAGTTNIIDNSVNNFGNLWVGGDTGLWSGSGTVKFQNSGTVTAPAVLWNGNPLQNFNGTINIGATNSSYRMFNGIAYNSSAGGGTGTSVSTFDAHNVAWMLGDIGYSASQVQDTSCTLVQMGSISASNANTSLKGNSATPVTFEVGALNTSTTFAGTINDWSSSANTYLTKVGSGTLTLSGVNTYTGDTTVNAGTLELAQSTPTLGTNSTVAIASGAHLKLTVSTVTNQVAALVLNGVSQTTGMVYNSGNSGGYITGSGSLLVGTLPTGPSGPGTITNSFSGGVLSLSWPSAQGWRLQMQTNSLSTGLSTNWVYITDGSISSTNITVDPAKPAVFYRLTYP